MVFQKQIINKKNGAIIVIIIFVLSQFLSVDLFIIKGFVFSLQKVLAIVFFPFAMVCFGRNGIKIQKNIIVFSILFFLTFAMAYICRFNLTTNLLLTFVTTGMYALTAVLLLSAFMAYSKSFDFLGKVWITIAIIVALLTFGQFLGIFPDLHNIQPQQYVVDGKSYFRGAGTLQGPNYMAVLFLAAMGFVLGLKKLKFKLILLIILTLGVFSTVSRMGLLGLFCIICISPFYLNLDGKNIIYRFRFVFVIILAVILSAVFPTGMSEILFSRITSTEEVFTVAMESPDDMEAADVIDTLKSLSAGGGFRFLMIKQAMTGIMDNKWIGIGGYNSSSYIEASLGLRYVLHNTYLEFLLAGGLFGLLFLAYFFSITIKSILINHAHRGAVLLQILIFCLVSLFLSFDTDFYIWSIFIYAVWLIESHRDYLPNSKTQIYDS